MDTSTDSGNFTDAMLHSPPVNIPPKFFEVQVAEFIELYLVGFFLFLGAFGNTMTLIVLARKRMRATTMSVYLSAAAIGDMMVTVVGQGGRHWVRNLSGKDPASLASVYCSFWLFLVNVGTSISGFSLAGVAAERCLAISSPLKSRRIICKRSAYIYTGIICITSAAYCTHIFWSYYVTDINNKPVCTINTAYYFTTKIRVFTDFLYYFAIPAGITSISNLILVLQVIKAKIKRDSWLTDTKNDKNKTGSTVAMLISVCVVYIGLMSPVRITYFIGSVFPPGLNIQTQEAARMRMIWSITLFMFYLNHAVNFFIYVASGQEFRRELTGFFSDM